MPAMAPEAYPPLPLARGPLKRLVWRPPPPRRPPASVACSQASAGPPGRGTATLGLVLRVAARALLRGRAATATSGAAAAACAGTWRARPGACVRRSAQGSRAARRTPRRLRVPCPPRRRPLAGSRRRSSHRRLGVFLSGLHPDAAGDRLAAAVSARPEPQELSQSSSATSRPLTLIELIRVR